MYYEVSNIYPKVGSIIVCDGWHGLGAQLEESDWDGAQFYVTTPRQRCTVAVNIRVTGRTPQKPFGLYDEYYTRIQIEFVGDGEPSTFSGGWLLLNEAVGIKEDQ